MKTKLFTAKELEQKAGVNPGTLRNLVAAGLPVAGKRKSQRGKPANLYNAAAVREWWGHRHIMGKENWNTSAILGRLSKLTGKKKPSKPLPPATDAELLDLGIDPVSFRKSEADLQDMYDNPPPDPLAGFEMPEMPDLSGYAAPAGALLEITSEPLDWSGLEMLNEQIEPKGSARMNDKQVQDTIGSIKSSLTSLGTEQCPEKDKDWQALEGLMVFCGSVFKDRKSLKGLADVLVKRASPYLLDEDKSDKPGKRGKQKKHD